MTLADGPACKSVRCHIHPSSRVDVSCRPVTSQLFVSSLLCRPSILDRLMEDTDLIPGMMLSNCRAETDLHNKTIGVESGSRGKTVVLEPTGVFVNNMSTSAAFICFPQQLSHRVDGRAQMCFSQSRAVILLPLLRLQVQIDRTFNLLLTHKISFNCSPSLFHTE